MGAPHDQHALAYYKPEWLNVGIEHPHIMHLKIAAADGKVGPYTFDLEVDIAGTALYLTLHGKDAAGHSRNRTEVISVHIHDWVAQAVSTFEADLNDPTKWLDR